MTEEERRRLELEAEAEAEAEYEYLQTQGGGAAPQKTFASELFSGSNSWDAIKSLPQAVGQGASNVARAIGEESPVSSAIPPTSFKGIATQALSKTLPLPSLAADFLASTLSNNASAGDAALGMVGMVPGATTAAQYAGDQLYDVPRPEAEYGKMLNQDLTLSGIGALAAPAAKIVGRAGTGAGQMAKDKILGLPESERLWQRAQMDEAYANTLNAGQRRTPKEEQLTRDAARYGDTFTEMNPVAGIDPSSGRAGFKQLEANLADSKVQAVKTRDTILSRASEVEASSMAPGVQRTSIGVEDLSPTRMNANGLEYGLENIANTRPGGLAAVDRATAFVQEQFGGRRLSAVEANKARQRIDAELTDWGDFDDQVLATRNITPSARDAYVEALQFYREQLDTNLKGYLSGLVGEEAAASFTKAGEKYAAASEYQKLAGRFKMETGQAFIPGSAKQVPAGSGPLGSNGMVSSLVREISPNTATAKVQTMGLNREAQAIAELQKLVAIKRGMVPEPLPRGWAKIKMSTQDLTSLSEAAIAMGLVHSIDELVNMPDEMGKQVVAQVAQAFPQAFESVPGNYTSVVDGKFNNPMERDLHIRNNVDRSPKERAMAIGGAFQNRFIPIDNAPTTAPQARSPQVPTQRYIQAFEQPVEAPVTDGDKVLQQLRDASSRIDTDRSGM